MRGVKTFKKRWIVAAESVSILNRHAFALIVKGKLLSKSVSQEAVFCPKRGFRSGFHGCLFGLLLADQQLLRAGGFKPQLLVKP